MAEFIIAFLAGVAVGTLWLAAWHIGARMWEDRPHTVREFKARVGGDPTGERWGKGTSPWGTPYGSAHVTDMSSNYAPATIPTATTATTGTMANVDHVTWSYEDFGLEPPETDEGMDYADDVVALGEADEFNAIRQGLFEKAGVPYDGVTYEAAPEEADEFNLGEALYGTLPETVNRASADYDITAAGYEADLQDTHLIPPFPEAPHLEAADIALLDPAPIDTRDDAAYEAALSEALIASPATPDTRASIADFLRDRAPQKP